MKINEGIHFLIVTAISSFSSDIFWLFFLFKYFTDAKEKEKKGKNFLNPFE